MKVSDFLSLLANKNPEYELVFKPSPFGSFKVVISFSQKKVIVYLNVNISYEKD